MFILSKSNFYDGRAEISFLFLFILILFYHVKARILHVLLSPLHWPTSEAGGEFGWNYGSLSEQISCVLHTPLNISFSPLEKVSELTLKDYRWYQMQGSWSVTLEWRDTVHTYLISLEEQVNRKCKKFAKANETLVQGYGQVTVAASHLQNTCQDSCRFGLFYFVCNPHNFI